MRTDHIRLLVVFLFLSVSFVSEVKSQERSDNTNENIYVGFGAGPETGISFILPKVSYYRFNDGNLIEYYIGLEGNVNIVSTAFFSSNAIVGLKKSFLTLDNSVGVWYYPKTKEQSWIESTGPYFHCTMNPKIGIKVWRLWLKAGPSVFLYKDYANDKNRPGLLDLTKYRNVHYNIEILFIPD